MEERRKNNRIKLTSSLFIKRLDRDTQEKVEIEILDVSSPVLDFHAPSRWRSEPFMSLICVSGHRKCCMPFWRSSVLRRLRMGLLMEQSLLECRSWRHPESSFMILSII